MRTLQERLAVAIITAVALWAPLAAKAQSSTPPPAAGPARVVADELACTASDAVQACVTTPASGDGVVVLIDRRTHRALADCTVPQERGIRLACVSSRDVRHAECQARRGTWNEEAGTCRLPRRRQPAAAPAPAPPAPAPAPPAPAPASAAAPTPPPAAEDLPATLGDLERAEAEAMLDRRLALREALLPDAAGVPAEATHRSPQERCGPGCRAGVTLGVLAIPVGIVVSAIICGTNNACGGSFHQEGR